MQSQRTIWSDCWGGAAMPVRNSIQPPMTHCRTPRLLDHFVSVYGGSRRVPAGPEGALGSRTAHGAEDVVL